MSADFYSISEFIKAFDVPPVDDLWTMRREAESDNVPIIREEMENFLKVILRMKSPKRILELGSATGYSSVFMAKYTGDDCHIDTIENYEPRIPVAKENFKKYGVENKITLYEGDCEAVLDKLECGYDLIFIDAAKGQYPVYLKKTLGLAEKGAVIIADNILCDMDILQSKFIVNRRDRTIHERMREFLYEITHSDILDTTLIPLGDGVSVSIRKD